jgi:hypothetical protein
MHRYAIALTLGLCIPSLPAQAAAEAPSITEDEAHAIGVEAYLYFYPIVTMDLTRKQLTNVEAGKGTIGGPTNAFNNIAAFPTADMKVVVRPNFDTLYSSAWLDLTKGANGRFGPRHGRTLRSSAYARHVDRRVCFARLADHRDGRRQFPDHA